MKERRCGTSGHIHAQWRVPPAGETPVGDPSGTGRAPVHPLLSGRELLHLPDPLRGAKKAGSVEKRQNAAHVP